MWDHFLNFKLSHIAIIIGIGIAWGSLTRDVQGQAARINSVELKQGQQDDKMNALAVTLGEIKQHVDDIWMGKHGHGN